MSDFKVYLSPLKEIACQDRLKAYYHRQKKIGKAIYYLLPSSKWLQEGRKRQPGLAFKTFDDIADLILKKANIEYIPVSEGERDLFFQQLLLEENVTNSLYKARGYSQTYGQLKRLGLTIEDLPANLRELKRYLKQYEEHWVIERKLLDPENRFHQAFNIQGIELPLGEVIVDGYIDFSPLQYGMLKGLIKLGINTSIYIPAVESEIVEETLKNLREIGFTLESTQYPEKKEPQISIMKGVTIEEEIHGVLDDIAVKVNEGKTNESIGIVFADDSYLSMLQRICPQYKLQLAIPKKSTVLESNLFKTISLILRENPFSSKWEKLGLVDNLYQLLFKKREDYLLAKEKYLKNYTIDKDIDERLKVLVEFRKKLDKSLPLVEMISLLSQYLKELNLVNHWKECFKRETDTRVLQKIRFEWLAYQTIVNTLKEKGDMLKSKGLQNLVINLNIFILWLSELFRDKSIYLERTPAKGIQVYNFREVPLFRGDTLYVMGMNEGVFPKNYRLAGYLNEKDLDIEQIYGAPTRSTLKKKDQGSFMQLFYLVDNLTFSYVCGFDPENELQPSPFIEQYCKECSNVKRLTAEARYKRERILYKEQSLEQGAFMLGLGKNVENAPEEYLNIQKHLEYLLKGEEFLNGDLTGERHPKIAVTALEQYSQCPFKYGVERLLKIKEPLAKREKISPLMTGTMFHKIIEEFYRTLGVLDKPFSTLDVDKLDGGEDILLKIFEGYWQEIEKEHGDIPSYYLELEKEKWAKNLKNWWKWERKLFFQSPENNQLRIFKFEEEVEFPFQLEDGEIINLTGKIDRIDVDEKGFVIYDYKTGRASLKDEEIFKGLKLQIPLYIYILEQKIKGGEYEELSDKLLPYGAGYISIKELGNLNKGFWKAELYNEGKFGLTNNMTERNFRDGESLITEYNLKEKIKELWERIGYDYSVKPLQCYDSCIYKNLCRVTDDLKEEGENGV
ncbi:PD-(D/E)XK nuclease family protein [Anaerobranca gottschalkii]|uniref:ATP-dependent helicase/DNAse subunit B n=1 Tax=Anaerobranca gottschalkii DSM 13577 TaxID=1120990 RepID=A0A1H9YH80_9FIRM|nr:PD-(D/E)XK nuclease family protein [Anaerobranca gottschalkii]SES68350.1 ATP-dependent helicase/DNAse subunit B [Anaerobranca gottschalkii DSM 13577]